VRLILFQRVCSVVERIEQAHQRYPLKQKKGLKNQPLKVGAGEEGRTPDLMLGKQDQDSSELSEEDE